MNAKSHEVSPLTLLWSWATSARLRRVKPLLVILGWGATIASITLGSIFLGELLPAPPIGVLVKRGPGPLIFLLENIGVDLLGGLVVDDIGRAMFSFFASYILGAALVYSVLVLPGLLGGFPSPEALFETSLIFTFTSLFPLPLLIGIAGSFLGALLAERLF